MCCFFDGKNLQKSITAQDPDKQVIFFFFLQVPSFCVHARARILDATDMILSPAVFKSREDTTLAPTHAQCTGINRSASEPQTHSGKQRDTDVVLFRVVLKFL